ncbi:unnamed protein product [Ilex paraguariensis]|uniref:Uncharacterized protein n=1 Tax=Ilex paraguariensis TaxID=185542 RepID=A0ABC8SDG7_9AQUA
MPKDFVLPLRTVNFPQICQKIIVISGTLVENLETTGYSRRFLLVGKDIMVLNISRLHILQTFLICLLFDRGNAKSVKFSRSRSLHVCISLDSLDFSVKRRLTQDSRKPHFGCGSQLVRLAFAQIGFVYDSHGVSNICIKAFLISRESF